MNKYESLLDYKKSLKDWHYDPSIPSNDCQYVGRFIADFETPCKDIDWGQEQSAVDMYDEDVDYDINSISWGKKDHIRAGYNKHNTKKYQISHYQHPDKIPQLLYDMAEKSGLGNTTVGMVKFDPGQQHPWHFDTYQGVVNQYKEQGIELGEEGLRKIKRYWIALEDWQWGHFMQIGNNVITHWKAGDTYTWNYGMYHLAANVGITPRISAQITGMETEDSLHLSPNFKIKM